MQNLNNSSLDLAAERKDLASQLQAAFKEGDIDKVKTLQAERLFAPGQVVDCELRFPSEIPASGNWDHDNAAGRELAAAYVAAARTQNNPCLINGALRSIANAGRWSGVEVGFSFALAAAVVS